MDSKEVMEKSKDLGKATAANASSDLIIKILTDLKTGVKASEDLLRSTKVGVVVNRAKSHKDPKVQRLAVEIVKKWRDDIEKQKGRGSPTQDKKASAPGTAAAPASTNGASAKFEGPLDQRDYKKDKVDINKTNQATRDNCIGLLYNGLCYMSPNPPNEILAIAIKIEAAGMEAVGPESNPSYTTKMRTLYMNLKNKSNAKLRKEVLDGDIAPERLVKMSSEELKSDERREADDALIKENMKEAQMPQAEKSISTAIHCKNPKCKGKDTVAYTQAQTRSADEPMTTFCECKVFSPLILFVFVSLMGECHRSIMWSTMEGTYTHRYQPTDPRRLIHLYSSAEQIHHHGSCCSARPRPQPPIDQPPQGIPSASSLPPWRTRSKKPNAIQTTL